MNKILLIAGLATTVLYFKDCDRSQAMWVIQSSDGYGCAVVQDRFTGRLYKVGTGLGDRAMHEVRRPE